METQPVLTCPSCSSVMPAGAYFCPNCGKQYKNKPLETTGFKKAIIYCVSLFLPPFGLWYAVKYLKDGSYEARKIAIISIILTVISTLITIWMTAGFINAVFQSLNQLNNLNI